MKRKIIILLVSTALIFGILSGCTETKDENVLKAIFEYSPTEALYKDASVTFVDKSTGENIESWEWDFGDGETSAMQNPIHTFSDVGSYEVRLIITDTDGEKNTTTQTITVEQKPPTADFSISPTEGINNTTPMVFGDTSTIGDVNISSWSWDFGDNTTSTQQNPPDHYFTVGGTYTISLTVTDENGLTSTKERMLSVKEL